MRSFAKNLFINISSGGLCANMAQKMFGVGIPIFLLHRMRKEQDTTLPYSAITDTHLRRCLQYLQQHRYTFLSIRQLAQSLSTRTPLPEKCAVFTMDDGFEDQVRIAGPVFQEFGCPVTIFLVTGMLDQLTWPWDDKVAYAINKTNVNSIDLTIGENKFHLKLSSENEKKDARRKIQNSIKSVPFAYLNSILSSLESATEIKIPELPPKEYSPLSWDTVRQYEKTGIEFGPHTVNHYILSKLDRDAMKQEILGSWERVKTELSDPSPIFCYPTGRYCDFGWREINLVRESGFIGALSTIAAQVRPKRMNLYYQYALPRYPLPSSFNEFKLYCSWLEYIRERNLRYWPE